MANLIVEDIGVVVGNDFRSGLHLGQPINSWLEAAA
jgi:hypothetical protein